MKMKKISTLFAALFLFFGMAQAQDVYFAGNGNGSGKIWKNNTLVYSISDTLGIHLGDLQIANDSTIFTAGHAFDTAITQGRLWLNDSCIFADSSNSVIKRLLLDGNGWTATGFVTNATAHNNAAVWQNGNALYTQNDTVNSFAYALAVNDNDTYYAGSVMIDDTLDIHIATVWKNDTILWQEEYGHSCILDLCHDGTDLYAVGYFLMEGLVSAALWQNDSIIFSVGDLEVNAMFSAMAIYNGNIYLAGYIEDTLTVWQNDEVLYSHPFTDSESQINALVVNEFGIFYTGQIDGTATVWKDGEILYQPEGCDAVNAICVLPPPAPQFYTLTVEADSTGWGTVSGGGEYLLGDTATIAAFPNAGCEFLFWNDGIISNPRDIVVTQDSTFIAHFGQIDYLIETSVTPEDAGTVTAGGTYHYGDTITLEVTANPGFAFAGWNDGNTNNPRNVIVTQDSTFVASFGLQEYTITVLSDNVAWGFVTGSGIYHYLDTIEISATPYLGFEFQGWTDGNNDNPRTIVVTEDHIYTAHFYLQQCLIKTGVTPEGAGTIDGGGTYDYGSIIRLMAHSNTGYVFEQWSDGAIENPRNVFVEGDATYIAKFSMKEYQITTASNPEEGGTTDGDGIYHYGDTAVLKADPNPDYMFICWNDGIVSNPRKYVVTQNASFTALFHFNGTPVTEYTVNVVSNDTILGTVSGGGTYSEGTSIQISAIPNEEAVFTRWSDGVTTNPRIITVIQDITYTAFFEPKLVFYTVTVESESPFMGSVYGSGTYPANTEISIGAIPNQGFHFAGWQDGNVDNPRIITVMEDATYTASFSANPVQSYIVTVYFDENQGFVIGAGTYVEGSTATIAAIPADGYEFVKWGDNNTDNPRDLLVDHDIVLAAFFNTNDVDENGGSLIRLYPNPAHDKIHLEGLDDETEVSLYNALGMLVKSLTLNGEDEIFIGDLPAGLYSARFGRTCLKFMKY